MTNKALLFAALATFASLVASDDADACGGYMPQLQVFRIAQHGGRAFAITHRDDRDGVAFTRVGAAGSYDTTHLASLGRAETPMQLTLVGATGNAKVTTRTKVLLAHDFMFAEGKQVAAMELPKADQEFAIAVAGEHVITEWREAIERGEPTRAERAWLVDNKLVDAETRSISRTELGGGLVGLTQWKSGYVYTTVRNADGNLATSAAGAPIGVVVADGESWIILEVGGLIRAQQVY